MMAEARDSIECAPPSPVAAYYAQNRVQWHGVRIPRPMLHLCRPNLIVMEELEVGGRCKLDPSLKAPPSFKI